MSLKSSCLGDSSVGWPHCSSRVALPWHCQVSEQSRPLYRCSYSSDAATAESIAVSAATGSGTRLNSASEAIACSAQLPRFQLNYCHCHCLKGWQCSLRRWLCCSLPVSDCDACYWSWGANGTAPAEPPSATTVVWRWPQSDCDGHGDGDGHDDVDARRVRWPSRGV